ncbi:poly(A) RNA polymerase gld-2 homolog B-like [Anticarsia gemmatalis]|uniref:poly(A) RNA polymerase gld-2 homolog B-like n=1 Tax=Anticarsia gemmatalis TaxID=129554 RepID=UPI003F776F34
MNLLKVLCVVSWSGCAVGAPLCLLGGFSTQLEYLLDNEMLSPQQVTDITNSFDELEDTLRTRWEGAELLVYGSLPAGLASKTSDVDFHVHIPNYNDTADVYIVQETAEVLNKQPEKYGDIVLKLDKIVPMMTYYDIPLQRYIDLSFRSESGVENTKLVAYYLKMDERSIPVASTVKFWAKVHQLAGKGVLPNYAIYLMVVFYLQQKNMGPPAYKTQENVQPRIVNKWNTNFTEIPYKVDNNESEYELLGGFFKYYNDFDFTQYCVSPYAGRPVLKADLVDVERIPEEFSYYKAKLEANETEPIVAEEMCVQDIFEHNSNVAQRVSSENVLKFTDHVKFSAKMYDILSSDRFLRSILVKDLHNETMPVGKGLEVLEIRSLADCLKQLEDEYYNDEGIE